MSNARICIARVLAECVCALHREGRGAEAEEAIRQGRVTAERLGPYASDAEDDDGGGGGDRTRPSADAIRRQIARDAGMEA